MLHLTPFKFYLSFSFEYRAKGCVEQMKLFWKKVKETAKNIY